MKKEYVTPELKMVTFNGENVLANTSSGLMADETLKSESLLIYYFD
ncbi:MAG: hypothetical protein IJ583_05125 [Firmicutes bacterium]|nr:hypothetical protein [Bacillota bacterium]